GSLCGAARTSWNLDAVRHDMNGGRTVVEQASVLRFGDANGGETPGERSLVAAKTSSLDLMQRLPPVGRTGAQPIDHQDALEIVDINDDPADAGRLGHLAHP